MSTDLENVHVISALPLVRLARELRQRAAVIREQKPGIVDETMITLELDADRIEAAIREGANEDEWLDTPVVAAALDLQEESVRARCRRVWSKNGLARRRGGTGPWEIHRNVLAGHG